MKNMFAPWRAKYITQEEKKVESCVFCEAFGSDKDETNLVVRRAKNCFLILNKYPYNNGHTMIVINKHDHPYTEVATEILTEVMKESQILLKILQQKYKPDGFNLGFNLGRVSGAGIEAHLHYHIVPRWNGDTNFMPVLSDTKVISEGLSDSYRKIQDGYRAFFENNKTG